MRLLSCATLAAVIAGGAAFAQQRDVTGELTYRERVALPDGAVASLELRDETGRVVAARDIGTEGRQVPIPFDIKGPTDIPLVLRGAIQLGGEVMWVSDPAPIPTGSGPVAVPPLMMHQHLSMGFASTYRCGDRLVEIGFINDGARLRIGADYYDLHEARTASGAKYEAEDDPGTFVWSKGPAVTVSIDGGALPECHIDIDSTANADFVARGNEPGWSLTLTDGSFTFTPQEGDSVSGRLSAAEVMPQGRRYTGGKGVVLAIADALCRDSMTGMPYPRQVTLMAGEREFKGCGGAPEDLLTGQDWLVEDIGGGGIIDSSHVTLTFANGRVSGRAGCNSYFAGYELTGESLRFRQAGATMMACAPALMDQERKFLDALASVTGFDFSDDGALLLKAGDETVLKARH